MRVSWCRYAGQRYVVRFGRDFPFHHVYRDREVMATRAAHAAGFAPELVHAEPGVMVSRFIDGKTYDETDVRDNAEEIARLLRRFHETMAPHISGPGFIFWVFHVIRDYAKTLAAGNSRMSDQAAPVSGTCRSAGKGAGADAYRVWAP